MSQNFSFAKKKGVVTVLLVASSLMLVACSSPFVRHLERSEGLLGALSPPGPGVVDAIPVQTFSSGRGRIYTSFVDQTRHGLVVHGLVRRAGAFNPGAKAHLDYEVFNAGGRVIEQGSAEYFPHDIPPPIPGRLPQSKYWIQLHTANPPAGSRICLYFRDQPQG